MEIIRLVSDYDLDLFNNRSINITQLVGGSISDVISPKASETARKEMKWKKNKIKIIIPDKNVII